MIKLDCKALQIEGKEFAIEHAQALLSLEKEKGFSNWELSPDSGYTFNDGTIKRSDKGADKKSAKSNSN